MYRMSSLRQPNRLQHVGRLKVEYSVFPLIVPNECNRVVLSLTLESWLDDFVTYPNSLLSLIVNASCDEWDAPYTAQLGVYQRVVS